MATNTVIVSHKFLTQPDDDLVLFLSTQNRNNVLHIRHSFSDAKDRCSYYSLYKNGALISEFRTKDYKDFPEPLIYLKEMFYTFKWVITTKVKWNRYVGMDGLCVLFGLFLKKMFILDCVIYWAVDFVPKSRFKSGFKDKIYHRVNILGYKNTDEMWDLSPRMLEAREKYLNIKLSDYAHHKVVPYGVWLDRIKRYSYDECEKNTLVFMGHLLEKQGVQLIIRLIPEILKSIPEFRFKIIGDGSYKKNLEELASEVGVAQKCIFLGKIDDIKKVEEEIAKSALAIAPYIKSLDTWTYYADPGKVKTYLACGVPVLLTDVPWNATEIDRGKCGKIISEDTPDIIAGIIELLDKNNNQAYRDNAVEYSKGFDFNKIFKQINL